MTDMGKVFWSFPVKLCPLPSESLLGYLLRVAHRQGLKRLKNLYQVSGYKSLFPRFYNHDIRPLGFVVGQPPAKLLRMNYNPPDGEACKEASWYRGHKLSPWQINQPRPKICISCLKNNHVIPDYWDLTFFVACQEHGEYLTRTCPQCGQGLKWGRPAILTCHCGYDFTIGGQKSASSSVLSMVDLCMSSLGIVRPEVLTDYSNELLALDPDAFMQFVGLVGLSATSRYGLSLRKIKTLAFEEHIELLKNAYHVICDWPDSFRDFLEKIMGKEKVSSPGSFRQEMFGSFYTRLNYSRGKKYDFVMRELAVFENRRLASRDQIVAPETVKVTELGFAKRQLNISPEAILKSALNGGLFLMRERRYRIPSRIVIAPESLKRFKIRAANRLSYSGARRMLGLEQKPMDHLLEYGVLTKDTKTILDGRAEYSLIRSECQKILKAINGQARPLKMLPPGTATVSFTRLLATYSSADVPVKIFIDLFLDGEIDVYCNKKNGNFRDFLFSTSDIREFLTSYLRADEDLLTYDEIEQEYWLGESLIRQLIQVGKLEDCKKKIGGRIFQFVPRKSLENWLAEYVTLKRIEIPGRSGITNKSLEKVGVQSIIRPSKMGGAHWYRRDDIAKAYDLLCR